MKLCRSFEAIEEPKYINEAKPAEAFWLGVQVAQQELPVDAVRRIIMGLLGVLHIAVRDKESASGISFQDASKLIADINALNDLLLEPLPALDKLGDMVKKGLEVLELIESTEH